MTVLEAMEAIIGLCAEFDGRCGVAALNLQTEEELLYHGHETFPTASVIKLPVLVTLMQQCEAGERSLAEPLMLRRADQMGGSGVLRHLTPGLTMTVRDWAFLMMNLSDNTATNVLIDHVGLMAVQEWLVNAGYSNIQLHNKIDFPALAHDQNHFGTASPYDLTRLMTAVFRRQVVSANACGEMLRMMDKVGEDRIGRYLPLTPFGADVPDEEKLHLAGKTGSFVGTRAQTAVIWRGAAEAPRGFVITVMTEGNPAPETWSVDAAGVLLIGRIARIVYDSVMDDPAGGAYS